MVAACVYMHQFWQLPKKQNNKHRRLCIASGYEVTIKGTGWQGRGVVGFEPLTDSADDR
jgi:hypothetical protein